MDDDFKTVWINSSILFRSFIFCMNKRSFILSTLSLSFYPPFLFHSVQPLFPLSNPFFSILSTFFWQLHCVFSLYFSVIFTFSGISVFLFPVSFSFPFSTNSTSIFVIFSREPNFERRRFLLNTRPLCAEAYTNNISFFRPLNSAFFSQLSISFIISLAVFV